MTDKEKVAFIEVLPNEDERRAELREILTSGRNVAEKVRMFFACSDTQNLDLSNIQFSLFIEEMQNCDFSYVTLRGCSFPKKIRNVNFYQADLRKAQFYDIKIENCRFDSADLSEANFSNSTLSVCDFASASLMNANFRNTKVHKSIFYSANLRNINLTSADFRDSSFTNATIMDASAEMFTFFRTSFQPTRGFQVLPVGDPRGYVAFAIWDSNAHTWIIYSGCRKFDMQQARSHWTTLGYDDGMSPTERTKLNDRYLRALDWLEEQGVPC